MLFVFFLAFSLLPSLHAMICNHTVNGHMYDLTPLKALGDISVVPNVGSYNYYIAVCGSVANPACADRGNGTVCQVRKSPANQFEAIVGYSDTQKHPPEPTWTPSTSGHGGVELTFTNGDMCNLRTRTLIIDFQCDHNNSRPITVTEDPACTFNVVFPTNHTCLAASSSSSSTGHSSSSSSTGHSSSSSHSSSSAASSSSSSSSGHSHSSSSSSSSSSTGHISSSSIHPSNFSSSSTGPHSNSSSTGPHSNSSSSSSFSSSSIDSSTGTGSSSIPSNWSSSSTGESSSSGEPNPTSIPSSSSSSTGTNPTNAPSKDEATSITAAGIGIGVLIGTGATSALVLLWCCYDRNRRRGQNGSTSEQKYSAMDP